MRPRIEASNIALIKEKATSGVLNWMDRALQAVFSYDPSNPVAHEKAVDKYLVGAARSFVSTQFAKLAENGKFDVTSSVQASAVAELTGDRAVVLACINQKSTDLQSDDTSVGLAVVSVVAVREDDSWVITEITAPARIPADSATGIGPAATRDAAVVAARKLSETFSAVDPANAEEVVQRRLKLSTGTLHQNLQDNHAENLEAFRQLETTLTTKARAAAATKLDLAVPSATVLVLLKVRRSQSGGTSSTSHVAVRITVKKTATRWKAAKLEMVRPE